MAIARCSDKMELKKGLWTREEDLILINHIQRHGHTNWRVVPQQAGLLRGGKSCRLRWVNYLRPDIKRGNFTREEEETIIKLHEMWGNRWSAIAAKLPGRTDNEIKNVWHAYLKKRLPPQHTQSKQSQNREQNADQSMESQKFDNQESTQKEQQQQQPVMNFNFSTHHDHVIKVAGRDEMPLPLTQPLSLPTSSKQDSNRDMSIFTISDSNNERNNNLIVANNNNVNKDHDMLMNNNVEPQGDEFWSEFLSGDEGNPDIGVADLNFQSPFSPISSFHNMDFWEMFK